MGRASHTNKSRVVDDTKREEMVLLENINQVITIRLHQTSILMRMRVLLMLKMKSRKMDNKLTNRIGRKLKTEVVSAIMVKENKVDVEQVNTVNNKSAAITTKVKILVSMYRRISQMDRDQLKERSSNKLCTEK